MSLQALPHDTLYFQPEALPPHHNASPITSTTRSRLQEVLRLGCWVEQQLNQQANGYGEKPSLRSLARELKPKLPLSTLWRARAIFRLAQKHPEILSYQHLGVAHFSVLLGLDPATQLTLIREAETQCWSRRQIARKVAALKALKEKLAAPKQPVLETEDYKKLG